MKISASNFSALMLSHVCMCWYLCIQMVSLSLIFIQQAVTPFKTNGKPLHIKKFRWKVGCKTQITFFSLQSCFANSYTVALGLKDYMCVTWESSSMLLDVTSCAYLSFRSQLKKKKRFRKVSVTVHKILWFYFPFLFSLSSGRSYRHASERLRLNTV